VPAVLQHRQVDVAAGKLDTASGGAVNDNLTAFDNGNNTIGVTTNYEPGVIGMAARIGQNLPNVAQWLGTPDSGDADVSSTYTVETFLKADAISSTSFNRLVLHWDGAYHLGLFQEQGSIYHRESDNGLVNADGGTVEAGRWHHLAATADPSDTDGGANPNGTVRLWVDGQNVASTGYDGTIGNSSNRLFLGSTPTEFPFVGLLDDVRIYDGEAKDESYMQGRAALMPAPIVQTIATDPAYNGLPVSDADLLQAPGVTTTTTGYSAFVGGGYSFGQPDPNLKDGSAGLDGIPTPASDLVFEGSFENPQWSVTFDLDLTGAPAGYDITQIDSFSGWSYLRASQLHNIYVSTVGDAGFTQLLSGLGGTFGNSFGSTQSDVGLKLSVTRADGLIAGGVDAIRFEMLPGGVGGHVYREIDVFGTPTVIPEPSTFLIWSLGLLGFVFFSRRKRPAR